MAEDKVAKAIRKACTDAGLPVMVGLLEMVRERESVDEAVLASLTDQQVIDLFEAVVGPAADEVEMRLESLIPPEPKVAEKIRAPRYEPEF